MALRNRMVHANVINQENIKETKSMVTGVTAPSKRAALGEIGNKVTTVRGTQPIGKSSLLQKVPVQKKIVKPKVAAKPADATLNQEKVTKKPLVNVVKPMVNGAVVKQEEKEKTEPAVVAKKPESFSSDLLAVEDIDKEDENNPLLVSVYTNDIYAYLMVLEAQFPIRKDFLRHQEVTPKMRCVLIDWLVEVQQQFRLMQETLYLTVANIDRFLQDFKTIGRKRLQLVGVAAMFIACKYEELYSPDISDFVYMTDNAYSKSEILQMETLITRTLGYSFGRPLPIHFLRRYSKAGKAISVHHSMAKYFLEQCLIHYHMAHYSPSIIAAAALYLALYVVGNDDDTEGKQVWTSTLVHYSTYTEQELLPIVQEIAKIIVEADTSKHQAVRKKYTDVKHLKISLRAELKSPTLLALAKAEK